jgi:hypothetical protein
MRGCLYVHFLAALVLAGCAPRGPATVSPARSEAPTIAASRDTIFEREIGAELAALLERRARCRAESTTSDGYEVATEPGTRSSDTEPARPLRIRIANLPAISNNTPWWGGEPYRYSGTVYLRLPATAREAGLSVLEGDGTRRRPVEMSVSDGSLRIEYSLRVRSPHTFSGPIRLGLDLQARVGRGEFDVGPCDGRLVLSVTRWALMGGNGSDSRSNAPEPVDPF